MVTNILNLSLEMLNDTPGDVYALSYDPDTKAYQVLRLLCVTRGLDKYAHTYNLVPFSSSHFTIQSALADAIKLKSNGYGDRQFGFVDSLSR